jgi:hypothetical protein
LRSVLAFIPRLWSNWISLLGAVLTTVSALAIILLAAVGISRAGLESYTVAFLVMFLPALFVVGLLLIPVGLWWERKRNPGQTEDPVAQAFVRALQDKQARGRIVFVAAATFLNVLILAVAGEKAVSHMNSPGFCGTACHTVMQPEWEAYNRSPHSRVKCVDCHIGPGASWAVKSKVDGLRQVWGVMTDHFRRPIPTPVEELRPSRDTCEQCHWPAKFHGTRVALFPHYLPDEANTPSFNAVLLKVGGQNPRTGRHEGIHWHVSPEVEIRYEVLDRERRKIGKIAVLEHGKVVEEYKRSDGDGTSLGTRVMDCVDCHNRPTHIYDGSPQDAVDHALYAGVLDTSVPHLAKVAAEALANPGIRKDHAQEDIRKALEDGFKRAGAPVPAAPVLDGSAQALAGLYSRNNYPAMSVTWNTYRSHLGHQDTQDQFGCFRCHGGLHEGTFKGDRAPRLSQDCDLCHTVLANEENPEKFDDTLKTLLSSRP